MIIVRYADDIVVGFQHEDEARRFWDAMRERLRTFSLSLHPEKTRLIEFGRFAARNRELRGLGKLETFKFLGFVFICSKSRRGDFQLRRKSRGDRMGAKLREIREALRKRMHVPIPECPSGDSASHLSRLSAVEVIPAKPRAAAGIRLAARGIGRVPPEAEPQALISPNSVPWDLEPAAEIVPERHAVSGAGLGEAQKGIAAVPPQIAARPGADLAASDLAADIVL